MFPEVEGQANSTTQSLKDPVTQAPGGLVSLHSRLYFQNSQSTTTSGAFALLSTLNLRKPLRLYDCELQTGVTENHKKPGETADPFSKKLSKDALRSRESGKADL